MAFKDTLSSFFDNTGLAELFSRKPHDPTVARKPLLKGIEVAKKQFENGSTKGPNRWWKVSNGVVALTVKLGGDVFEINGVATNHMPQERFVEFLDKFSDAVNAGEFDSEIEHHGKGDAKVHIAKAQKGGKRTYSEESMLNIRVGGFRRGGMSDKDIRAKLLDEGVSKEMIDKAIARKKA